MQPAASDDGVALGAVFAPYLDGGGRLPMKAMRHAYFGPEYSDAEIEKTIRTYKLRAAKLENVAATAADLLARGKILGWFQGRMEFGPRALGHRSILADPRDPEMNAKVNNAVKFREWWRPFAPSMLEGSSRRISRERLRFAVHDSDQSRAPGKARRHSLGDARGRQRAPADGGAGDQSAVLESDQRIRQAHGRAAW